MGCSIAAEPVKLADFFGFLGLGAFVERNFSLSLRNTLIAALAFAALLPLLVVSVYTTVVTEDRLSHEEMHAFENRTLRLSQELSASLSAYLDDLRALERVPPLQGLLKSLVNGKTGPLSDPTESQWRHRLAQIFLSFAEAKGRYHQLRLVDEDGAELVRVVQRSGETKIAAVDELRNVGRYPFFSQALALPVGRYIVADRLVEDMLPGSAPMPRPVIRFATPVADSTGRKRGVLAIDIDGQWLLDWLRQVEQLEMSRVILADRGGRYLYHRNSKSAWGIMGGNDIDLDRDFPGLRNDIAKARIFGHRDRDAGTPLAFAKVRFDISDAKVFWMLVNVPMQETFGTTITSIRIVLVALFMISLLVAVSLGYWLSAAWVIRPIDALLAAVRRFGSGELSARAMTFADNEIGRLAKTFNDMAHFHESSLQRERAQAEQLQQAAHVFEYTRDGVTITDRRGKILAVNKAFTEITGYSEAEALGRNPRMLKSHRHDDDFYRNMWGKLSKEGHWQGEIWNRRKSGEVYPEWLTITRVDDEWGETTNYVAVFSDISSRKREQERLSHLAHFDILTDLPNRLLFTDRVRHAIQRAKRDGHQCALLFLDLDKFKPVNDEHGHLVGDQVLQAAAWRFVSALREEDTISRLGGDEFAVLLESIHSSSDAEEVAKKLVDSLRNPLEVEGEQFELGVSVGFSIYPEDGITFEALLKQADQAMYGMKMGKRAGTVGSEADINN